MRVNIYAEEITDRVEIISKEVEGRTFTAVRFYLELPATVNGEQHRGPFIHRPGDDDSSAVTFWGKRDMRPLLRKALALLDGYYGEPTPPPSPVEEIAAIGDQHLATLPPEEQEARLAAFERVVASVTHTPPPSPSTDREWLERMAKAEDGCDVSVGGSPSTTEEL